MKASRCGRVAASYPPGLPPAQEGASSCGPAGWRPAVGGGICVQAPLYLPRVPLEAPWLEPVLICPLHTPHPPEKSVAPR